MRGNEGCASGRLIRGEFLAGGDIVCDGVFDGVSIVVTVDQVVAVDEVVAVWFVAVVAVTVGLMLGV